MFRGIKELILKPYGQLKVLKKKSGEIQLNIQCAMEIKSLLLTHEQIGYLLNRGRSSICGNLVYYKGEEKEI